VTSERERIYSPQSTIRKPLKLVQEMLRDVMDARYIAWRLFVRDTRARYRQTALGYLWAFLPPLALAAGLTLASEARVLTIGATEIPYAAYVIFGAVIWQTFTEVANGPIQAVSEARTMLTRVNFPREALIMAKMADAIFNFFVKLVLIAATFAWYQVTLPITAFAAPLALAALFIFGLAVGLLLAPVAALYQDFSRGLTILLGFWFFLTPIAYPLPKEGLFGRIVVLNPLTPLITTIRELTYVGTLSETTAFVVVTFLSLIALTVAWVLYRVSMPLVIERMSA
jgi:lipopolysaccharide transport system permease protein